jgi:hypothetical protein
MQAERLERSGRLVQLWTRIATGGDAHLRARLLTPWRGQLDEPILVHPEHRDARGHGFQATVGFAPI